MSSSTIEVPACARGLRQSLLEETQGLHGDCRCALATRSVQRERPGPWRSARDDYADGAMTYPQEKAGAGGRHAD